MTIGKQIGLVHGTPVLVGSKWKREDGVVVEISEIEDYACYPIKGTDTETKEWSTYTYNGTLYIHRDSLMDLLGLVSNPEESTPQLQEVNYTKDQIRAAFDALNWTDSTFDILINELENTNKKNNDPEYQKYLELKAKFES
jgi:hypothetical protein